MLTEIATAIVTECVTSVCVSASKEIGKSMVKMMREAQAIELPHIADFWENRVVPLKPGMKVTISGSLSRFAPMFIGPPKLKRDLHLTYRRSLPQSESSANKADVDANLAFSAGQMAWRFNTPTTSRKYLGLYQSIFRTSIPSSWTRTIMKKVLNLFTIPPYTIEARITGFMDELPCNTMQNFIKQNNMVGHV